MSRGLGKAAHSVALAYALVACRATIPDGAFICSSSDDCPAGLQCAEGYCYASPPCSCPASQSCLDGVCVECVTPAQCSDNDVCTADRCDDHRCAHPILADGDACQGQPGYCAVGICRQCTAAAHCTDTDPCTLDGCGSSYTCTHTPASGPACDDANPCTQTDTCQNGLCVGGNPVLCTPLDACHVAGGCDPASGVCTNPTGNDGAVCTDGNPCTYFDACQGGVCGGTSLTCNNDPGPCGRIQTCDGSPTCASSYPGPLTLCDDGNVATTPDRCDGAGGCVGNKLKGVQYGQVSLAGLQIDATLNAVTLNRSFLVFGTGPDDANPACAMVSGQLTTPTRATFRRYGSTPGPVACPTAVAIYYYVVEFTTGVSVQRGSITGDPAAAAQSVTIQPVDLTHSFPIISASHDGTSLSQNDFMRAKLADKQTLTVSAATPRTVNGIAEWQVVTYDDSVVQSGDLTLTDTMPSAVASITTVDPSKAWLIYTYDSVGGDLNGNIGQKLIRGTLGAQGATFDRDTAGSTHNLTWYVIEFMDPTLVHHAAQSLSGTATMDVAVATKGPAQAIAAGGYMMEGGRSDYTTDDNPGAGWFRLELVDTSTLRVQRGNAQGTASIGWSVIEFDPWR